MKTQTFNIALPRDLVEKIDKVAQQEEWEQIFQIGKASKKAKGIKTESQINKIVREYRHGK